MAPGSRVDGRKHVGKKGAELEMSIRITNHIVSLENQLASKVKIDFTIMQGCPQFPTRFESFIIMFTVR